MAAKHSVVAPVLACMLLAAAVAGCADGSKGLAEATGLATTAQESKTFVRESRPAELEYIPVGTSVSRTAPRKDVAAFKALEADLEAKRLANEAAGARARTLGTTPPPAPAKLPTD